MTDGTNSGTQLVKDINAGATGSNPQSLVSYADKLFFTATDAYNGISLFVSNGTSAGTMLIGPAQAIMTDPLMNAGGLILFNSSLAFNAFFDTIGDELWFYKEETTTGIQPIVSVNYQVYPNPFSDNLNVSGLQAGEVYECRITDVWRKEKYWNKK